MRASGILPGGKLIEGYVQQADIAPTILSLLGAEKKGLPKFDGVNLLPVVEGEKQTRKEIFIEDHEQRAVVQSRWKYIRNYFERTEELYDLESDPMEVLNLAAKNEKLTQAMRKRLFYWVDKNLGGQPDPMWMQMAKWSAQWAAALKKEFPDLRPRPTIIHGVDK